MKSRIFAVLVALGIGVLGALFWREYQSKTAAVQPITFAELKAKLESKDTQLHVVHLWATWCAPCIREIPIFAKLEQTYGRDKVRLYLISGDDRAEVRAVETFLKERGIRFPSYILGDDPNGFIKQLHPAWSGALPATFFFKPGGALHSMLLGETTEEQLENKIKAGL